MCLFLRLWYILLGQHSQKKCKKSEVGKKDIQVGWPHIAIQGVYL